MDDFKPVSEYRPGVDPELVYLQTRDGTCGLATFLDCSWMRQDGEDVPDAFSWEDDHEQRDSHVEWGEVEVWRPASKREGQGAWAEFEQWLSEYKEPPSS